MSANKKNVRIAILGAGSMGKIQAQVFHRQGADVCSILCSSKETANAAAQFIKDTYGITVRPFYQLDVLFRTIELDAVSVCTPPHLHFDHIFEALNRKLPVFCEKPMFWSKNISEEKIENSLNLLQKHPNRYVLVNTSNAELIKNVRHKLPYCLEQIDSFSFKFNTHGGYRRQEIAVDLLPHALSLLFELFGNRPLKELREQVSETEYKCQFTIDQCFVSFDLSQNKNEKKMLAFAVNGQRFLRLQRGNGNAFEVALQNCTSNEIITIQNPLEKYISDFIRHCSSKNIACGGDNFNEAATNLRLMKDILIKK